MNIVRIDPQNDKTGLVSMHDAGREGCMELGHDPCTDHVTIGQVNPTPGEHREGTVAWLRGILSGFPDDALIVASGRDHVRRTDVEIGVLCRWRWSPDGQVLTLLDEQ